jgi:hypothetical protein
MNETSKTLRADLERQGYSKEEEYFSLLNHELIGKNQKKTKPTSPVNIKKTESPKGDIKVRHRDLTPDRNTP